MHAASAATPSSSSRSRKVEFLASKGRRGRKAAIKNASRPNDALKGAFFLALIAALALTVWFNYVSAVQPQNKLAVQDSSIALSLAFPLIAINILLSKGMDPIRVISELGLSRAKLTYRNIGIGLLMLVVILFLEVAISGFSSYTGIPLPTNTSSAFQGAPLYVLAFTVLAAPLDEEILFRGFLVKRFGVILSAILFMVLHSGYASISEALGALVFGLVAGYVFRKTESLYPSVICHVLVNLIGILALVQ